jgi:hypothetical protein
MARGERDLLAVPVLPGAVLNWPAERESRGGLPFWVIIGAACAGLVALVAIWNLVAAVHGSSKPHAAASTTSTVIAWPSSAASPTTTAASPPPAPAKPSAAELRLQAARRIVARLPVELESAALLRNGGSIYVVGGAEHGRPSDSIWQIDPANGRVRPFGRFIEPLTEAAVARRGGALYLAGGWTGEKQATAVLRWVPGQADTLVARLPVSVRGGRAAFVGGLLYVAGGTPRQVFAVDVASGTVTTVAKEPRAVGSAPSNLDYLAAQTRAAT